mmetsp:Transcript_44954/g.92983  ORF Transcript_44954/g.92983 Transcript_44954/m.92983 type:complete len:110 (-) Transcript_44954:518-847(-)
MGPIWIDFTTPLMSTVSGDLPGPLLKALFGEELMETLLEKDGKGGAAVVARREAAAAAPRPPFCSNCSGLNFRVEIGAVDFTSGLILGTGGAATLGILGVAPGALFARL